MWRAVDGSGSELGPEGASPAAALAAAPEVAWPLAVVSDDGTTLTLAAALGRGGERVALLLDALLAPPADAVGVEALVPDTPAGEVILPVSAVPLPAAVGAQVDPAWLADLERERAAARRALLAAGREDVLEAALHVTLLLATERLDPPDDADVDAHVASGAQLWLLAGAVASALGTAGGGRDPFAAWGRLVAAGWWPVGPCGDRLVVSPVARPR